MAEKNRQENREAQTEKGRGVRVAEKGTSRIAK